MVTASFRRTPRLAPAGLGARGPGRPHGGAQDRDLEQLVGQEDRGQAGGGGGADDQGDRSDRSLTSRYTHTTAVATKA